MPTIKEFEKHRSEKPHHAKPHTTKSNHKAHAMKEKSAKGKKPHRRRPGMEQADHEALSTEETSFAPGAEDIPSAVLPSERPAPEHKSKAWDREAAGQGVSGGSEELNREILEENPLPRETPHEASFDQEEAGHKAHLEFFGSEMLRARLPKTFELAEAVADDWVKDGRFDGLPVGHPLAQLGVQKVLRTAKDVEKKLDEKGVFMLARVGLEYAKSKLGRK